MTQKSLSVTWHDHLQHLSGLFQDLYENKKLVDVTLYCTGGSLKAHKIVLSACSPFFAKIFQENEFQHPIIILKGITFEEMHLLLEFMYKGSINIFENELDSLIQAGSYLEIKGMDVKNIPSSMKNTAKRPADEAAIEPIEITKKIREDREETSASNKDSEQMQTEEIRVDVVKDQTTEPTTSKTEISSRRETRFKGQKRVDVHMFSRPIKGKSNDEVIKSKSNHEDLASSPKHSRGKSNTDAKAKTSADEIPLISRVRGKLNNSPITIKKEKPDDKPREKDVDKEKIDNDDIDVVYSRVNKSKLNSTAPAVLSKKNQAENKSKQFDKHNLGISQNIDSSFEDTISKIVIKDVYSTEDRKTSTPIRTYERSKKVPTKKDNTPPDLEKDFIPVIPDVIMNESDTEINVTADDNDHFDDDPENDDEGESDMLQVSHLECSQCKKIYKTDEELKDHMKTHSGKPYKCDYCDSYFQRMSHLVRHRRTHTGEKPFSCRECGKCFSRQDKLKQHIRIHDENEYKPPPHLRRVYEPPLPLDERRGRGRPRKYPYVEKPKERRPRGRPRKYSLPNPGEHVENYDITNLPFGDFSYLTSPLPDFSDLTIIPVSYTSKSGTAESTSSTNVQSNHTDKEDASSDDDSDVHVDAEETVDEKDKNSTKNDLLKNLSECSIKTQPKPVENEEVSIININEKEKKVTPNDSVTIINLNDKENETTKIPIPESIKHLSECTIEAVAK